MQDYLAVRGVGSTDHVFLYRNRPVRKDLLQSRIKAAGVRTGVKVSPHCLRHTFATQLVNAGCRITSIQKLLGHRRLSSTMIYARVHDRTVAEDYYTAMARIEAQLGMADSGDVSPAADAPSRTELDSLLGLLEALAAPQLDDETRLRLVVQLWESVANR